MTDDPMKDGRLARSLMTDAILGWTGTNRGTAGLVRTDPTGTLLTDITTVPAEFFTRVDTGGADLETAGATDVDEGERMMTMLGAVAGLLVPLTLVIVTTLVADFVANVVAPVVSASVAGSSSGSEAFR